MEALNRVMTANDFRAMALGFEGAVESAHMGHADFRVKGKIFATLGYPGEEWGVVCLGPEEQGRLVAKEPEVFAPVKGGWGKKGNTQVLLKAAGRKSLREALGLAWKRKGGMTNSKNPMTKEIPKRKS